MARLAHETHAGAGEDGSNAVFRLDATWRNYLYVGILQRLFPNARFVECVRDARDIALSCYFRDVVEGSGLPFSYDLVSIAAVVNGYRSLMAHWRRSLPISIHTVEYEKLVLDPEDTCVSLARFLGVDDFEAPGDAQGRRLRAKSLRRYRHYREHLDAFVAALEAPPGELP